MIKVENIEVYNIARAVYSARNALNSWDKSDSDIENDVLGENDLDLARRLFRAGHPSRKFLRQIFVSMDIVAPLYWWKQADQTKVGTVTNSCSTMHKIHDKEFTLDDFSHEHLKPVSESVMDTIIRELNSFRNLYLTHRDKEYWWQMIQLLPSSYNQRRTLTMNYENVANIIEYRSDHKLDEWRSFVETLKELPYVKEIIDGV